MKKNVRKADKKRAALVKRRKGAGGVGTINKKLPRQKAAMKSPKVKLETDDDGLDTALPSKSIGCISPNHRLH